METLMQLIEIVKWPLVVLCVVKGINKLFTAISGWI